MQPATISPSLLPLSASELQQLMPIFDLGITLLHPANTSPPLNLRRITGDAAAAVPASQLRTVDGVAGAKRKRPEELTIAKTKHTTGSRGFQQVMSARAQPAKAGQPQSTTRAIPISSLGQLAAPSKVSSTAASAAAASSVSAIAAAKPGRGLPAADKYPAAAPKLLNGKSTIATPESTLSRTKLKQSGNDADHPITLDDSVQLTPQKARPVHANSSSAAAAASASLHDATSGFHLTYPPTGSDQVVLGDADLALLKPGEFLNDSVIDFGLKSTFQQLSEAQQRKFYFFNTFFYTRWCGAEEKCRVHNASASARASDSSASFLTSSALSRCSGFAAVAKWTKGVDIFSRDFLVVPINDSLHWSVAIICYPAKFFQPTTLPPSDTRAAASAASPSSVVSPPAASFMSRAFDGAKSAAKSAMNHVLKRLNLDSRATTNGIRDPFDPDSSDDEASATKQPPSKKARTTMNKDDQAAAQALCVPAILYLDSLLPPPTGLYRNLTTYLQEEWAAKAAQAQAQLREIEQQTDAAVSDESPFTSPSSSSAAPASPSVSGSSVSASELASLRSTAARSTYRWVQPPYIGGKGMRLTSKSPVPWNPNEERVTQHALTDQPLYEMKVPLQQNGCDCGLYVIE
jgi:hypothetical protein